MLMGLLQSEIVPNSDIFNTNFDITFAYFSANFTKREIIWPSSLRVLKISSLELVMLKSFVITAE